VAADAWWSLAAISLTALHAATTTAVAWLCRPSVPANTPLVFDVQLLYIPGEGAPQPTGLLVAAAAHSCIGKANNA